MVEDYSLRYWSRRLNSCDIASILRRKIINGEFNSTKMLPSERSLADRFKVARRTVRGAIKQIEQEALVTTKNRSGTFVTYQSIEEPVIAFSKFPRLDVMETRIGLESHVCRLVAINGGKQDFDMLDQICDAIESGPQDWIMFLHADIDFHTGLARATGNSVINHLYEKIGRFRLGDLTINPGKRPLDGTGIAHLNSQHRKIVRALRLRESSLAANAMKQHVNEEHIYSTKLIAN